MILIMMEIAAILSLLIKLTATPPPLVSIVEILLYIGSEANWQMKLFWALNFQDPKK